MRIQKKYTVCGVVLIKKSFFDQEKRGLGGVPSEGVSSIMRVALDLIQ